MKKSIMELALMQRTPYDPVVKTDLSGKTVMLVGANTGIGFEAVKHFASMYPARLIMVCRNAAKGQAAKEKLETSTGYKNAEVWLMDLAKMSTIVDLADKFEKDGGRLDIIVANAGITADGYETTADGWESMIGVNHLGTALLSILLYPRLLQTAQDHSTKTRLVIVASDTHYMATIPDKAMASPNILAKMNDKAFCTSSAMRGRYPQSKLLNVFFARAFNDHISSSAPVIVNSVNPGFCTSELGRKDKEGVIKSFMIGMLHSALAHTAEEGSRQLIWASVGGQEQEEQLRGAFIWFAKPMESSDFVLSPAGAEAQQRIWDETIEILEKATPKVRSISDEYFSGKASI